MAVTGKFTQAVSTSFVPDKIMYSPATDDSIVYLRGSPFEVSKTLLQELETKNKDIVIYCHDKGSEGSKLVPVATSSLLLALGSDFVRNILRDNLKTSDASEMVIFLPDTERQVFQIFLDLVKTGQYQGLLSWEVCEDVRQLCLVLDMPCSSKLQAQALCKSCGLPQADQPTSSKQQVEAYSVQTSVVAQSREQSTNSCKQKSQSRAPQPVKRAHTNAAVGLPKALPQQTNTSRNTSSIPCRTPIVHHVSLKNNRNEAPTKQVSKTGHLPRKHSAHQVSKAGCKVTRSDKPRKTYAKKQSHHKKRFIFLDQYLPEKVCEDVNKIDAPACDIRISTFEATDGIPIETISVENADIAPPQKVFKVTKVKSIPLYGNACSVMEDVSSKVCEKKEHFNVLSRQSVKNESSKRKQVQRAPDNLPKSEHHELPLLPKILHVRDPLKKRRKQSMHPRREFDDVKANL